MRPVIPYLTAALLFGLGVYGVLRRRNAILLLMAVELMLGAVNLILITATAAPVPSGAAEPAPTPALAHTGQVFALFVIVVAAAEVGVGLAIMLQLYRLRTSVAVDTVPLDDGGSAQPGSADLGRDQPVDSDRGQSVDSSDDQTDDSGGDQGDQSVDPGRGQPAASAGSEPTGDWTVPR